MRFPHLIAIAAVLLALPAIAAQNGTITFDVPNTGGAPTGYRLFRDGTIVGSVTNGQTFTALSPVDVGTVLLGIESFNATGTGPRVNKSVTLGAVVPGPVRNVVYTFACAQTTPPTCTVTITDAP